MSANIRADGGETAGAARLTRAGERSSTCRWSRRDAAYRMLFGQEGDPLLTPGVHWAELLVIVVRVLVAFGALLGSVMLMIWFERKLISDMQDRIGPNRAGPFGILQTLADGIKLFFKEDLLPERADSFVFKLAPYLSIVPALVAFTDRAGRRAGDDRASHIRAAGGRPPDRDTASARHVVDLGLRGNAGRMVVGLQVPAPRLGAGRARR